MTDNSSNNSGSSAPDGGEVYNRLSKIYGCWGIRSIDGWTAFVAEWMSNGGPENGMDNAVVIVDSGTRSFTAWHKDIFDANI